MLSGIPQVAQIGPSLVAKNGTPFCLFTTVCERHTGTSADGLNKIIMEQPIGQMIGGLFFVILMCCFQKL